MSDTTLTRERWDEINTKLREPFDPSLISFRPQSPKNGKAEILAYVDARDVQDRLDEAAGAGNWSFDWEALRYDAKGSIALVKGNLTICGVCKSDVGEASTFSPSKGAVSDALKRAAAQWGIARYLYDLPRMHGPVDQYGHIAPAYLAQLRAKLPTPGNTNGRVQVDDAGEPDEGTPQPPQANGNGNAAKRQPAQPRQPQKRTEDPATDGQRAAIRKLTAALGVQEPEVTTAAQAREEIGRLSREYQEHTRHRDTGHASESQPEQDGVKLHPTLQDILNRTPDLRKTYQEACKYGLRGDEFFRVFLNVAGLSKAELKRPLSMEVKQAMAKYVAGLAQQAQAAQARTPDLATVATPAVRA